MNSALRKIGTHTSRTEVVAVVGAFALAGVALLAVLVVKTAIGGSEARLLADPAMYIGFNPMTGAVSYVGVLAWCAAAVSALFAASVLDPSHRRTRFLLAVGGLSAWLGLDDLFLIHETVGSLTVSEIGEKVLFGLYGLTTLGIIWHWRDVVLQTPALILVLTGFGFAASIAFDSVTPGSAFVLEDASKFTGVLLWSAYVALSARRFVLAARPKHEASPPARRRDDAVRGGSSRPTPAESSEYLDGGIRNRRRRATDAVSGRGD